LKFLVNPGRSKKMAKRKMPPRHKSGPKKGQFMSKAARKRKRNPPQKAAARRAPAKRAPAKRAPARRNPRARRPKMPDLVGMLTDGTMMAGQVLVGKAAARSAPDLLGFPKEGNVGLAIQVAIAVAVGFVADMFVSARTGAAILAGGLTAPLETFLVAQEVPWLGEALSPVTSNNAVGAYRRGTGRYTGPAAANRGLARYTGPAPALVAGFPDPETAEEGHAAAGVY